MKFLSTRGDVAANAAEAISKGLAKDGGLFVPETFPKISVKELVSMTDMEYYERAAYIISKFLEEYDYSALLNACKAAYSKFDGDPVPVVKIDDNFFVMELFHGPTLAFKDVALTLLPYLLKEGCEKCGINENVLILTATSGDTGKAALEGFKDVKGVKIMVFYPSEGVSDMQKLQMTSQLGKNVNVMGVKGNFDDCQTAVKRIFNSSEAKEKLKEVGTVLSSANSINFGRLVPQVVYYFSAYADLLSSGEIKEGEAVNFVVPTGNFGDILAGYYAKRMGLPVNKLICASNKNKILTDFIKTGEYNTVGREFYKTSSPSMDILISSNLERLVFELTGRDAKKTEEKLKSLTINGKYSIDESQLAKLQSEFYGGFATEEETFGAISDLFEEFGYITDTHTGVAIKVAYEYLDETKDNSKTVVLSTASPYKFPQSILKALGIKEGIDAFDCAGILEDTTAMPIPEELLKLKNAKVRFNEVATPDSLFDKVLEFAKRK